MAEEAQPVKRRPGRPRKTPVESPAEAPNREFGDVKPAGVASTPQLEPDERIGQSVADPRWTAIAFDDGREYRIDNAVIVERVS